MIGRPRADATRTEPGVRHGEPGALRICFVSADYPSDSTGEGGVGGIATHTATLARAIAGLGHEVTVLTESPEAARRYSDGDVNVVAVPGGGRRLWKLGRWLPVTWMRRSWAVRRALAALQQERGFDVVSFPDGYGEGWRYSYSPMTPFTVHLYGPASVIQRWDGRAVPPIRARMEEWMERRPVRRAALVVCASRRFADEIARAWAVSPSRVRIIRNPVDLSMFRPRQSGGPPGRRVVLFVGHLQRLKGVETLGGGDSGRYPATARDRVLVRRGRPQIRASANLDEGMAPAVLRRARCRRVRAVLRSGATARARDLLSAMRVAGAAVAERRLSERRARGDGLWTTVRGDELGGRGGAGCRWRVGIHRATG